MPPPRGRISTLPNLNDGRSRSCVALGAGGAGPGRSVASGNTLHKGVDIVDRHFHQAGPDGTGLLSPVVGTIGCSIKSPICLV